MREWYEFSHLTFYMTAKKHISQNAEFFLQGLDSHSDSAYYIT